MIEYNMEQSREIRNIIIDVRYNTIRLQRKGCMYTYVVMIVMKPFPKEQCRIPKRTIVNRQ